MQVTRGVFVQMTAAAKPTVTAVLRDKLAGLPYALRNDEFNALAQILELLQLENEDPSLPPRARTKDSAQNKCVDIHDSERVIQQHSIELRLIDLCDFIDEGWVSVIDTYFSGLNYCIKMFAR